MASKPAFLQRLLFCCGLLLLLVFSAGCVGLQDPETSQDYRTDTITLLKPGETVGQSFTSRRSNINQIQIYLSVDQSAIKPGSRLITELFRQPTDQKPIYSTSFELSKIGRRNFLDIPLTSISNTLSKGNYYLKLRSEDGEVQIFGRNEDGYAQGSAYINDTPIEADIGFRVSYDYGLNALAEDLRTWFNEVWLIIPLMGLLWLPGRLLLQIKGIARRLDWGERTAVAIGLSLSIIPLLMLWTTQLHLIWSQTFVLIFVLMLFIIYILSLRPHLWKIGRLNINQQTGLNIALACVFLFSLLIRLAMVRDLAAPAWVDSVHHALLARLIMENGGFPHSYEPYLQTTTASYHAGFHSLLAAFTWLSRLDLANAMLVLGQVLNASIIFAVYLLTKTFTHKPMAGIFAAFIAGLMTPMPAYYTSWGRYTQLAGLLILPVAFLFTKYMIEAAPAIRQSVRYRTELIATFLLAIMAISGLMLVHYRVVAFLGCLILAYLIVRWLRLAVFQHNWRMIINDTWVLLLIGISSVLITLPWWPSAIQTYILPTAKFSGVKELFSDFSWSYLNTARGKFALGMAGIGLLWSLVRRRSFGWVIIIWVSLMFVLANLGVIGLPGGSFINNTSVAISLFLPVALLGGYLIGWIVDGWATIIPKPFKPIYWAAICGISIFVAMYSARALLPILNPGTILVREADLAAIEWVDGNIPQDETILINPFLWGYGVYAGNDGGFWISPLTGRKTLPPPVLYNYDFSRKSATRIISVAKQATELATQPDQLRTLLENEGIRYIFIGARGGPLSAKLLGSSPNFQLVYAKDGVSIFKVGDNGDG